MTQHFLTLLTQDLGSQGGPDIVIRILMCTKSHQFAMYELLYLYVRIPC